MRTSLRISAPTRAIFAVLSLRPEDWQYGYDLSRQTDLKSGTLYPLLARLTDHGYLEARWVTPEQPWRPLRHEYRLSEPGLALATALAERAKASNLRREKKPKAARAAQADEASKRVEIHQDSAQNASDT